MNKTIKIYGASDDLIEVEGDFREEFYYYEDSLIIVSDGTVVSVVYGDKGIWRLNVISKGACVFQKHEGEDEDSDYSDIITLTGDIEWIAYGQMKFVKAKE